MKARCQYEPDRIGIINPYGDLWSWMTYPDADAAERALKAFWGEMPDMMKGFRLSAVEVRVRPVGEPFALPSAAVSEQVQP